MVVVKNGGNWKDSAAAPTVLIINVSQNATKLE